MKKFIILLLNIMLVFSVPFQCFASDLKVYVNGNEINDKAIIENDGKTYISISAVIEAIGGSVEIDKEKERVYITYDGVTYALRHQTYDGKEFDNTDSYFNNLICKVHKNTEYRLVQRGSIKLRKSNSSITVFIYEDKPYIDMDSGVPEMLFSLFDYTCVYKNNAVNIDKFDISKKFITDNIKLGMTMAEVNNIIPFALIDEKETLNNKLIMKEENQPKEPVTYKNIYYIKNDSKIELTFIENNDSDVLVSSVLLTSDGRTVEKIL